jgi:hypothetical protein
MLCVLRVWVCARGMITNMAISALEVEKRTKFGTMSKRGSSTARHSECVAAQNKLSWQGCRMGPRMGTWGGWARDGEKCGHRGSVAVQNKLSQAVITITCGSPSLIDRSSQGPQMFDPQQQLVICWRRNSLCGYFILWGEQEEKVVWDEVSRITSRLIIGRGASGEAASCTVPASVRCFLAGPLRVE